jgi:hypothetical protein
MVWVPISKKVMPIVRPVWSPVSGARMDMLKIEEDGECLYRYEGQYHRTGGYDVCGEWEWGTSRYPQLYLHKYRVLKWTKCGAWIRFSTYQRDQRFVNLKARKKFACKTEEDALESFIARKNRQAAILGTQLEAAEALSKHAKRELEKRRGKETSVFSDLV